MNSTASRERAVPAAMFGDIVRVSLYFLAGVGHSNREPTIPHHRQINHIVSYKTCFRCGEFFLRQNLAEGSQLVLNSLTNVVELKIATRAPPRFPRHAW